MKLLQEIIGMMKDDILSAEKQLKEYADAGYYGMAADSNTKAKALKKYLPLLELLLSDKPTVAITEAAHSANTMLGEVPTSSDNQIIGDVGADSSETEIVRQNEQTKELCVCTTEEERWSCTNKCKSKPMFIRS